MKQRIRIITIVLTLAAITLAIFNPVQSVQAQEYTLTLTFEDIGYGNLRMQSLFGSAAIWVPTRSDWVIQETAVRVRINYIASTLLIPEASTMTVYIAGIPVTSWRPVTDGQPHSIEFAVPTSRISSSDNGFLIQIQGQLLIDEKECLTAYDPGQWVIILGSSSVSFLPSFDTTAPQLENLPDEIVVKNPVGTEIPRVLFVLPENPNSVDLTTAGEVAARISREGKITGNLLVEYNAATVDSLQPEILHKANLVVIGEPTRNTLIQELSSSLVTPLKGSTFATVDDYDVPIGDGVIQVIALPWDPARRALIVSGGSPEGVEMAGSAFVHSPTYRTLNGRIKFVHALEPIEETDIKMPWQDNETSFAELRFGTRTITGAGTFEEQYSLEFPPGWVLLPGSQLALDIASSAALSSEQSNLAVFINEVPVGTVSTGGNSESIHVVFDLPVEQINVDPLGQRPHKMMLQVSVSNYLNQSRCSVVFADSAWTRISDTSSFITAHDYMATPDLQAFPYPFVNADADSTVIVIPEGPTTDEIETGINLASTLGRYTPSDFNLEVLTADKATKEALANSNLIIIGTFERNPLINEFNTSMGELNNPGVYEGLKDTSNGFIREGQSLWNDNRTALLVFAQNQEGVNNAALGLFDSSPPILQSGTFAVVDSDQNMRILEAFEQPPLEVEGANSGEVVDDPNAISLTEENDVSGVPTSMSESEVQVSDLVDEDTQNEPVLGQSPPILLLVLGLAVLAIPFTIWWSRNRSRS